MEKSRRNQDRLKTSRNIFLGAVAAGGIITGIAKLSPAPSKPTPNYEIEAAQAHTETVTVDQPGETLGGIVNTVNTEVVHGKKEDLGEVNKNLFYAVKDQAINANGLGDGGNDIQQGQQLNIPVVITPNNQAKK